MSQNPGKFSLKVLTINTHKGFNAFNRRFILPELRDAVRATSADIVFLQEVMGSHDVNQLKVENWPDTPHYEFLADTMWNDFAYGRNAVYPEGHHGNAVMSRFPIAEYENRDISVEGTEKRGLLHCRLILPHHDVTLHAICVHLGLRDAHRHAQLKMLSELVNSLPPDAPVVVAGDFNDWQQKANAILQHEAGMTEVFSQRSGRPARTFPARFPLLRLDRIYVKNAGASHPQTIPLRPWSHLSDHAPLAVEIHL
ncbi:endonuclease/exonuclease/phosphatase family protein [Erwinia sp. 9145]|uniref:endonuclease/exonuclease/phosphatase family protein n=1 Tax=Erwinia sp. 9145 TaxID=1500895 RepID=UPI00054EC002|nr:endonuclease/exonuclease/phosphatase family protein [Erwinia sp. 9145]